MKAIKQYSIEFYSWKLFSKFIVLVMVIAIVNH